MSNSELCCLGNLCVDGAGQTLASWQFLLKDVVV